MLTFIFNPRKRQFARFDPRLNLPESITAHPDGNLYVSLTRGILLRVRRDHGIEPVAVLPLPKGSVATGVKVDPDGERLYVASAPDPAEPPPKPDTAAVWRVSIRNGSVERLATLDAVPSHTQDPSAPKLPGFPNDLAFNGQDLYVTDSAHGLIWKLPLNGSPAVAPSIFMRDSRLDGDPSGAPNAPSFGVNGIAFDANHDMLYVCNQDAGKIYRIPFRGPLPPTLQQFADDPDLVGTDGIAFDARGALYAANIRKNRLLRVNRNGRVSRLADGAPLESPSSLAFGTAAADRHTLYVTNFSIYQLLSGASPDNLHTGILSLRVGTSGLPLP